MNGYEELEAAVISDSAELLVTLFVCGPFCTASADSCPAGVAALYRLQPAALPPGGPPGSSQHRWLHHLSGADLGPDVLQLHPLLLCDLLSHQSAQEGNAVHRKDKAGAFPFVNTP